MSKTKANVSYYPPGEGINPGHLSSGDIILTRRTDALMGKLINLFDRGFYCHAAVAYKDGGIITESLEWGVEVEDIEKYKEDYHYAVVQLYASKDQMLSIRDFIHSVVYSSTNRYGYLIIASLAISILTKHKLNFGAGVGTRICSGFAAETATRAGYIFDKPPAYMTPGDLVKFFEVNQPTYYMALEHKQRTGEIHA